MTSVLTVVMGCCSQAPTFGFERIFNRIRCVLALFGGKVIVQNSELCDGENARQYIYLDTTHPASFGGLDAVYRTVKEEGESKISRKQVQDW